MTVNETARRSTLNIVLISLFVVALMFAWPRYRIWQKGLAGEANLMQAVQERQILVEQARAERDAAKLRAEAIQIVGQAAKDFPEYRYQEFLGAFGEAFQNDSISKVVFIPTEANVPITETGRTSK